MNNNINEKSAPLKIEEIDPKIFSVSGKRIFAFIIDVFVSYCIAGVVAFFNGYYNVLNLESDWSYTIFFFVFYFAYNIVSQIQYRTTLGKYLCGIVVVNEEGLPPTNAQIFLREFIGKIVFFFFLSIIWIIIWVLNKQRRAIHDNIGSTYVVNLHLLPHHKKRKHLIPAAVVATLCVVLYSGLLVYGYISGEQVWNNEISASVMKQLESNNYGSAEQILKKAENKEPNNPEVLMMLGLLYEGTDKYDLAKEYFTKAFKANPPVAIGHTILVSLGSVYLIEKDYKNAADFFQTAINYPGADADTYYYLALCRAYTGNKLEALNAAKQALNLNPDHQLAKDLIKVMGESF